VKELFSLRAHFLYGDFVGYLEAAPRQFDLIFACGVLYHMTDPLHLLQLISRSTDRVFLWTLYVSEEETARWPASEVIPAERGGFRCRYHRIVYDPQTHGRAYSGTETYCCRLTKADIVAALRHYGYGELRVVKDDARETGNSNLSLVAWR
jgi:hypothetical protein